jgi:hypothetical protein
LETKEKMGLYFNMFIENIDRYIKKDCQKHHPDKYKPHTKRKEIYDAYIATKHIKLDDSIIYFAQMIINENLLSPIKIGKTLFYNLSYRLTTLQVSSPFFISLIGFIPQNEKNKREINEKTVHYLFRKDHMMGEWFSYSDRLKQYIEKNAMLIDGFIINKKEIDDDWKWGA